MVEDGLKPPTSSFIVIITIVKVFIIIIFEWDISWMIMNVDIKILCVTV